MSIDLKDLQLLAAEQASAPGLVKCPSLRSTCGPDFTCEVTTCSETVER